MNRLVMFALVASLVGCGEEADEMFPINPGGGGGTGGTSRRDASVVGDGGDGGNLITGRVCVFVANLRTLSPTNCVTTGADGITVELGTSSAMTTADGGFTLTRPADTTGLYWRVTDPTVVTSLVKYGTTFGASTAPLLPAWDVASYADMIAANSAAVGNGIVIRVTNAGAPVTGATVTTTPAPDSETFYDSDDDANWNTVGDATGTGGNGVAWISSIAGTSAQVVVTSGQAMKTIDGVQVATDALTFVTAEFP
jgi:hypothetical protein